MELVNLSHPTQPTVKFDLLRTTATEDILLPAISYVHTCKASGSSNNFSALLGQKSQSLSSSPVAINIITYQSSGSHSNKCSHCGLVGCDNVRSHRWTQTLRKNSIPEDGGHLFLLTVVSIHNTYKCHNSEDHTQFHKLNCVEMNSVLHSRHSLGLHVCKDATIYTIIPFNLT
jgi:hypothetical protein